MLTALSLLALTPDAAACGGFFCNNVDPVEQAGEFVVFEVDVEADQTTMHVQVEYEGPPMEFAWIVPVNDEPELFVSNDALFTTLQAFTRPRFDLWTDFSGECDVRWFDDMVDADAGGFPPAAPSPSESEVNVVAQQQVGPYDTVVLTAQNATALVTWLQDNGYAIPNALEPMLAPYVASRRHFVALRLSSGNDTGDLVPLGMRYPGIQPSIPIQLTAVAATDDMQLVTYVLGSERSVPTNYLHVELNETAIDWFTGGSNYMDVLSRAADEAGGHAFSTEFAGSTESLRGTFYQPSWEQLDLASSSGPTDFLMRVTSSGIRPSTALLDLFRAFVPVPAGQNETDVYNCPNCYPDLDSWIPGFDAAAAAAAMDAQIIGPMREIDGMFQRNTRLTRLGSTVSPSEMTIDPEFGFNPDMQADVPNWHTARLVYQCDEDFADLWDAPRQLVLEDGTSIAIPSESWLAERGMTASDWLAGLQEPAAARIERTGTSGQPEVLFDGQETIDRNVDSLNETLNPEAKGCGCSSTPAGLGGFALLGLIPLLARRRR